jgi:Sulfotransferase family
MLFNADHVDDFVERCLRGRPATLRVPAHRMDFIPGGPVLVVSFEPAATGKVDLDAPRPAWAQALVRERGHSLLGVKRETTNWYRTPELHALFLALKRAGFFVGFEKVLFCGPSMGGYAALAFASAAPGCTVLAFHPQTTLAPGLVWFDQRFAGDRAALWQGNFVDGADGARAAQRVYVCYDPYQIKDRLHAERLPRENLVRLRLPFAGHATSQALHTLGLLGHVIDGALAQTLDEPEFRRMALARDRLADYHCRLAERGRWLPRRQRHLARALDLQPGHVRASLLDRVLCAGSPLTAAHAPARVRKTSRWPAGLVTVPGAPLAYLGIPQSGQKPIERLLLQTALGTSSECSMDAGNHPLLLRGGGTDEAARALIERQLDLGALVFTFVRDPGRRIYACLCAILSQQVSPVFQAVRDALLQDWGVRVALPGQALPLEQQRENFEAFVAFVEANLAGATTVPRRPHWCPQAPMLDHYRKFLRIDVVGRVENFTADMAQVLHRAGVRRIPDLTKSPHHKSAHHRFEEVASVSALTRIGELFELDYVRFNYQLPATSA